MLKKIGKLAVKSRRKKINTYLKRITKYEKKENLMSFIESTFMKHMITLNLCLITVFSV